MSKVINDVEGLVEDLVVELKELVEAQRIALKGRDEHLDALSREVDILRAENATYAKCFDKKMESYYED